MGLVSIIPVDLTGSSPESSPSKQFIVFGIEGTSKPDIDSLELLQAYNQDGVICYFSAISYFDLTTQAPAHHHIASLTRKSPIKKPSRHDLATKNYNKESTNKNKKIGTRVFSFDGIQFYSWNKNQSSLFKNYNSCFHDRADATGYSSLPVSLWWGGSSFRGMEESYR